MPPIYSFALKINGVDVTTTYGFYVADLPNQWDAPGVSYEEVAVSGDDGTVATNTEPIIAPKDFVVEGNMFATTSSALESAIDALKSALFASTTITLIGGNQTGRYRTGVYASSSIRIYPTAAQAKVQFTVHCRNPIAYDTATTTVTGSAATDIATPLGTWRSWGIITLTAATNPLLTLKNSAGATVMTLQLTGTGTFIIDMRAKTIKLAGVRADGALASGDFFPFRLSDSTPATAVWCTVRSSSGSVSIAYEKAYA